MNSEKIRKSFISFFRDKGHSIVKSCPLVLKNDPSLMFVNAGMNQFKDIFLDNSKSKFPRVVNSQRCLRVSGKHNDLEEVGHDTYHHTMFEMLGNWSFGDYFKEDAILWSWEFLTDVLKIDKDRLYVTIFSGDKKDNLSEDKESKEIWASIISEDRIISCSKEFNFWEMGSIGPCGPCSEIHIDLRNSDERKLIEGKNLINKDSPEVVELWNLVFMEFNRKQSGTLEKLAKKHVDTGMGFERLSMVLQNKKSTYDTDIFSDLILAVSKKSGIEYGFEKEKDIAIRVIVDHVRAISLAIADGQIPSNVGAGYVIRRILRRAVRYGFSFLNFKTPFLHELVDVVFNQFKDVFSDIFNQKTYVLKIVLEEEKAFLKTLEKGTVLIQEIIKTTKSKLVDSKKVFELYDTYGFPKDLTSLILRENQMSFSEKDFNVYLNEQKERSKSASNMLQKEWIFLSKEDRKGFLGYENPFLLECSVKILMYRELSIKSKKYFQLVFNQTPFYPEGGGQVGDQGILINDGENTTILDTKKENNLILHLVEKLPQKLDVNFVARVNKEQRKLSSRNHTATHLLHYELMNILGGHVEQKGSLVNSKYLRFDFSHFEKINQEKLELLENNVNQKILSSIKLDERLNVPFEEAQQDGALALFGEKYEDLVRVIKFGQSIELCGGTHVQNTSEIGFFKILSEGSVASGVRRIEAVTSFGALSHLESISSDFEKVKRVLKQTQNPIKAIENLILENKNLRNMLTSFEVKEYDEIKKDLVKSIKKINGINALVLSVNISVKLLKNMSFDLLKNSDNFFLALFSVQDEKVIFNIGISKDLIKNKEWQASELIKEFSKDLDGAGGGQDFFASASGKNKENIKLVMSKINSFLEAN